MNVIDWLMNGDPSLKRLTAKYLLETERLYEDDGYIRRYLDLYDPQTGLWGGGVYGPKWISTHYTMFELMYMEIAPENPAYHTGLGHLLDHEWRTLDMTTHHDGQDVCVLAMVVGERFADFTGQANAVCRFFHRFQVAQGVGVYAECDTQRFLV